MDASTKPTPFDVGLDRCPANYAPLTPVDFLPRAAEIHPDRTAIIHGERRVTYRQFHERVRRLASALAAAGIGYGDTVSAMLSNTPEMLELHYAVPMLGAVLNTINTRLDAGTIAYTLDHGEAKALFTDREYAAVIGDALARAERTLLVVDVDDPVYDGPGERLGSIEYEAFIAHGDPAFAAEGVRDEWQALALNYTSGTTGRPKGVVYHHRGAYLMSLGNAVTWNIPAGAVYLWTLPMFHLNGWCYPWAISAVRGTHVCLRRVDPALIFRLIAEHRVTNMCGAPTVLNMLCNAPEEDRVRFGHVVDIMTGGSPPPVPVLRRMEALGFRVLHIYGMTEVGVTTMCLAQDGWQDLPDEERGTLMARQGVRNVVVGGQMVADPATMRPVPADGLTMGEVMLRGNTVMRGYLKDAQATEEAFRGGWLHSGDLAVQHENGYIEIKDRSKDIIISGGENISSIEVESVLYRHPAVMEAAVVASPDEKWGEIPCAFIALRPNIEATSEEIVAHCRQNMARYKVPRRIVFSELPKTSTGKIQKFELRERARVMFG